MNTEINEWFNRGFDEGVKIERKRIIKMLEEIPIDGNLLFRYSAESILKMIEENGRN